MAWRRMAPSFCPRPHFERLNRHAADRGIKRLSFGISGKADVRLVDCRVGVDGNHATAELFGRRQHLRDGNAMVGAFRAEQPSRSSPPSRLWAGCCVGRRCRRCRATEGLRRARRSTWRTACRH